MAGRTITAKGIGGLEALRVFGDVLAPACISVDHPRFLSFVPAAPTEASILFDLVVGASSIYAGSWMEGGGAVFAENEALRWIADLAGLPPSRRRCVRQRRDGGQSSALVAARWQWRHDADGRHDRTRGLIVASKGAHSSVAQAARVIDSDVAARPRRRSGTDAGEPNWRRPSTGLPPDDRARLFAIVATAGTTNAGVIDDLAAAADVCRRTRRLVPRRRCLRCCRAGRPERARPVRRHRARRQPDRRSAQVAVRAVRRVRSAVPRSARSPRRRTPSTPSTSRCCTRTTTDWNASDYAHHLSRPARGLPFWFSLATYGTDAYRDAVETTLAGRPRRRRPDPRERALRAGGRARALDRRVPSHGLELPPSTPTWSERQLAERALVRRPQRLARRDRAALLRGEPTHHRRRHRRHRSQSDLE